MGLEPGETTARPGAKTLALQGRHLLAQMWSLAGDGQALIPQLDPVLFFFPSPKHCFLPHQP